MKTRNRDLIIRAAEIRNKPFHLSKNLRIVYILKGQITLEFVAGKAEVREGEIEIININEPVAFSGGSPGNVILIFEFDSNVAKISQPRIDKALYNCNTTLFYPCKTKHKYQEQLISKLLLIYNLYVHTEDHSLIRKTSQEIEDLIVDKFHDLKNMLMETEVSEVNLNRFLRIYDSIYLNSAGKLNLKEIAEKEYVSVQYLSKEFNEKLNINFKATVEYYKVIQAARYLITTNMSVTLVSENSGFSAPRYFYKQFSNYLKCTPMEFRAKIRREEEQIWEFPVDHDPVMDMIKRRMNVNLTSFGGSAGKDEAPYLYGGEDSQAYITDIKEDTEIIKDIFKEACQIKGRKPEARFELLAGDETAKLKRFLLRYDLRPATMLISVDGDKKTPGELAYDVQEALSYMSILMNIASGRGIRSEFSWEISAMSESVDSILGYEPTEVMVGLLTFTFY